MGVGNAGGISHLDISVSSPQDSIRFYDAFFTSLGYSRWYFDSADWQEPDPKMRWVKIAIPSGSSMVAQATLESAGIPTRRSNASGPQAVYTGASTDFEPGVMVPEKYAKQAREVLSGEFGAGRKPE